MNAILEPSQLPSRKAEFIAYGEPVRIADPLGGDDPVTLRPQVFVRYYCGIKIKRLEEVSDDTYKLHLAPESIGFSKPISGWLNADDPHIDYIRERAEAGDPVDVGLECVRYKRNKDSREEISPATPIHALRGASSPDGTGNRNEMMGTAGGNSRFIVGVVNGRRTAQCTSDPTEWGILTSNTKGDLPPDGWRMLRDPEDWTKVGAIVAKDSAPTGPVQASGIDMDALAKMVSHVVRNELLEYGKHLEAQEAASNGTPTKTTPNRATEGKPWVTRLNKNQLNLGSYIVAGEAHALRWAYGYLEDADDFTPADAAAHWKAARDLAALTQQIADRVQQAAYGGKIRCDRTHASHTEATRWVRFVIKTQRAFDPNADDATQSDWFDHVGRCATHMVKEAEARAEEYLNPEKGTDSNENPPATSSAPTSTEPDQSDEPAPDAAPLPSNASIDGLCESLSANWNDAEALHNIQGRLEEHGLTHHKVWGDPIKGRFATETFEGAREFSLGKLVAIQQQQLAKNAAATEAAKAKTGTDDTTPATEDAPEATTTTEEQERVARALASALAAATSEEQVRDIFKEAKERNLLSVKLTVTETGQNGIAPAEEGAEGTYTVQLSDMVMVVTDVLAEANGEDNGAPAEAPQSEPAEDSGETAQHLAESAENADASTIEKIVARARELDLLEGTVRVRGSSGTLDQFLRHRLKRAKARKQ